MYNLRRKDSDIIWIIKRKEFLIDITLNLKGNAILQ